MRESPSEAWARCSPFIESALKHDSGQRNLDEVAQGVEAGHFHFWPGKRCAVVTEWQAYPNRKALNIWLMGGDLAELLGPMLAAIEVWASTHGADELFGGAYDRPGWRKALGRAGFTPRWIMFSKEVHR